MTAAADVASVIGGVLAEGRDTGYHPPAVCGVPYPLATEFHCTHPAGHVGLHGYDGPFPPVMPTCPHGKTGHCEKCPPHPEKGNVNA